MSAAEPLAPARPLSVLIAGGGTGGHLFPGIAVAQELRRRDPGNRVRFVSRGNDFERAALARTGFELTAITVEGLKGRGLLNQLRALVNLPRGVLQSAGVLRGFRPDLVIGLGSYAAGPVVLAAWTMRLPIALCEQNTLPGVTNRVLARFADRIFTSFERTAGGFDPAKVVWTGNPLRQEFRADGRTVGERRSGPFTVLVLGGSQGAHRLNTAVAEALERMERLEGFAFIHQTGAADEQAVAEAYRRAKARARVQAFFHDMAEIYAAADLVVCRAGATTVAEITALGKPALYVPFPFAADDHQRLNAGEMVAAGAAEMIGEAAFSGDVLAERIRYYAGRPDVLGRMAERAAARGRPDAAARIVDECCRLIAGRAAGTPPTGQRANGPTG
jgi:UDP-N-acetylglucosamine--N-acetylmuramyl-(pentapeptide) pyrophosphoryl-undecaprenol N-acetylglucosamine transferase